MFGAGSPLIYRKGDEDPAVDVLQLPQGGYSLSAEVHMPDEADIADSALVT